jgi:hypothetical protein
VVSEFVRSEHGVAGEVSDFGVFGNEGRISYKAPGYDAEVFFDLESGDYSVTVQQEGFVAVMNELHKGRDASTFWRVAIDISGGLLVTIALTGLGIQLFLRKRRVSALAWSTVGLVSALVLIWLAMA